MNFIHHIYQIQNLKVIIIMEVVKSKTHYTNKAMQVNRYKWISSVFFLVIEEGKIIQ